MDSGSGSMQSSSGGDEEYDSHPPPLVPPPPSFFNNIPPSHIISSAGSIPQLPFHLSHNYQNLPPTFYDFSSNYNLQPNFNPDASFINLDVVRPSAATLRPEPTATDFKNPTAAPSSSPQGSTQNQAPFRGGSSSAATTGLHPKVSTKKRTRASRRAPTTVLTTDTSNFRAMVQEFTGIPSPPFSAGGSSYSRRFDLFGSTSSALRSSATHLEPSGSALYPSRSKVQLFSSSTSPPLLNSNNINVMVDSAASTSYQLLPSDDHHQLGQRTKEAQTMSNMQQAGILSFQTLSGHDFNSKQLAQGTHLEPHIHGSSQPLSALQNDESWRGNGAAAARPNNNNANCKLNFSGSSSNLQRDKEMGNIVSTRGESTVDSWICPSD